MSTASYTHGRFPALQPVLQGRPGWGVEGNGPSRAAPAHRHLLKAAVGFSSCDQENNREMALNSESFFCGCVLSVAIGAPALFARVLAYVLPEKMIPLANGLNTASETMPNPVGAGLPCPPPIYRPASSPIRQQHQKYGDPYTRHVSRESHARVQFQDTRPLGKRCA